MKKLSALGVLGLALGSLLFTSCTAKYQRMLDERDREIVALKDERSRLAVELRTQKELEEAMKQRLAALQEEARRTASLLASRVPAPEPTPSRDPAFDPGMRKMASEMGLELKRRPGGTALVLPGSILFASGSTKLTKRGRGMLDKLAATIRSDYRDRVLSVEGHSDSQPIVKSKFGTNWRLSAERAESVRAYLNRKGVAKKKVRVVGYGPTQPVDSNKAESGRKRNRRVEVVIVKA